MDIQREVNEGFLWKEVNRMFNAVLFYMENHYDDRRFVYDCCQEVVAETRGVVFGMYVSRGVSTEEAEKAFFTVYQAATELLDYRLEADNDDVQRNMNRASTMVGRAA